MMIKVFRLLGLLGITLMGASCASIMPGASRVEPVVWYGMESYPYLFEVKEGVDAAGYTAENPVLALVRPAWSRDDQTNHVQGVSIRRRKGFSISPQDPPDANLLFEQLVQKKKFVVAYGSEPSLPTPASFTVATDLRRAASDACEELVKMMGQSGGILNVLEKETDPGTQARKQAIEAVVSRYPEVSITLTLTDITEVDMAKEKIRNTLAAHGDSIDGMIATGPNATLAAVKVLSERHDRPGQKRIRFIGLDTDPAVLEAINKRLIDATVAQNHFGQGYISCMLLVRMAEGWTPKKPYQFVDAGHVIVKRKNAGIFQEDVWTMADTVVDDIEMKYLDPPPKFFGWIRP